jgi:hypothetical protein
MALAEVPWKWSVYRDEYLHDLSKRTELTLELRDQCRLVGRAGVGLKGGRELVWPVSC